MRRDRRPSRRSGRDDDGGVTTASPQPRSHPQHRPLVEQERRTTNTNPRRPRNDENGRPCCLSPAAACLATLDDARNFAGSIVNHDYIQNTILLLIVTSAIMMGVATFPFVKNDPAIHSKFETLDEIILVLFTIESGTQLIYHGWTLLRDGFLVFDLLIVVASWTLVGAFRIFRAMRLVTRINTLRNLVLALFSVFPKMTVIFTLLMLIFYIFSVMMTTLFKGMLDEAEGSAEEPYFDSIWYSMFTLFQMMTMDEWAAILFQIQLTHWWAWMPFLLFIIITAFVVVNLIIAVICDAVHVLGSECKTGLLDCEEESECCAPEEENSYGQVANRTTNPRRKSKRPSPSSSHHPSPASPEINTMQRIEKMQLQLDEMLSVQKEMKSTMKVLTSKLRASGVGEEECKAPIAIHKRHWSKDPRVNALNDARKVVGEIVNNDRVSNAVLVMIVINALMMGAATLPFVKHDPVLLSRFEVADTTFLVLFTIESAMQMTFHGWKLFRDEFLVFDLLIVVASWTLVEVKVFKAFRIFRTMRMIRRIDTLRNLVVALFGVFPEMSAIFTLLALIFYIFSVMFTQLFKDMCKDGLVEEPYFDSIYHSLFTLFQMMTLDEWAGILFQIQRTYPWAWLPFVVFIFLTGFVVVNLIVAVICDAVSNLGETGLQGYGRLPARPMSDANWRFDEMQQQLRVMVLMQTRSRFVMTVLIRRLRARAVRETVALLMEAKKKSSSSRTLLVLSMDSMLGEGAARCGTLRERTWDGDPAMESFR